MNKFNKVLKVTAITVFSLSVFLTVCLGALAIFVYSEINFEADERLFEGSLSFESTTFYASSSSEEYAPVAIEQSGSVRKNFYSGNEISPYLKNGFVAVEDKIFYSHNGFDIRRSILAALNYIFGRDRVFGASTITQQVVKNISGDNDMTVKRKLSEIIRAIHIERNFTKDEILEVYLNVIPMSDNIFGVGAASRAYFGVEPSELSPAQAATLIGITNAPTAYNPYANPDACRKKRDIVLGVMHTDGVITDKEYSEALGTPLAVIPREERSDRFDSWFVEVATRDISRDLAKKYELSESAARMMLLGGGYKVYTTMDISVQNALEEYFENLSNFPEETAIGLNYAMVVTNSKTGDLAGVIGRVGRKEGNLLLNHAVVPHTPGSVMKPLALYAPLIDEGKINWATVFDDIPTEFIGSGEDIREYPYTSPKIYDGLTPISDALRLSKNTVAVRLCGIRTPKRIFESLKNDYGFTTLIENENKNGKRLTDIATAPMALGQLGRGVSLLELTEAYSVFAGNGVKREMRSYLYLDDYKGRRVLDNEQEQKAIIKDTTARIMNQLLMGVVNDGTAKSITLDNIVATAGKTGTSGGSRDKMFVGYTPYYTASIWCGYDSGERAVTGLSKSHLEIWDSVMNNIHRTHLANEDMIDTFSTAGLLYLPYCKDSGGLFTDVCVYDPRGNRRDYGYFTQDNQPSGECTRHVLCLYDTESKALANKNCPKENLLAVALLNIKDRSFPKEIYVTDAEYVYRDVSGYAELPNDDSLPYFQYTLPPDTYVGITNRKKQFNCSCNLH